MFLWSVLTSKHQNSSRKILFGIKEENMGWSTWCQENKSDCGEIMGVSEECKERATFTRY